MRVDVPVLLPWLILIVSTALSFRVSTREPWLRLGLSVVILSALAFGLVPLSGSLLRPVFPPDLAAWDVLARRSLIAVWWLMLARSLVIAGHLAFRLDRQHRPTRLATDLVAGAVYLAAAIAVLDLAFGVSVTGLVATSGIIAIVLGLALQSTLGDLFSGLALGLDGSFKAGDLISIEGSIEGRVIDTSWRSTRLLTSSADLATIPNSLIAKSRLLNRSWPSEDHRDSVTLMLDPEVPLARALEMLEAAALTLSWQAPRGKPTITCTELRGDGFVYEIAFTAPLARVGETRTALLGEVARHAHHAGIAIAPQNGTDLKPKSAPTLFESLKANLLLEALSSDEVAALAAVTLVHDGAAGEMIFEQDGHRASMFLVHRGAFEVCRDDGAGERRLGAIGPGDFFGELALLTGTKNAATVRALTPFTVYEVTKAAIDPLLRLNPGLMHTFEKAAARAQALLDRTVAAQTAAASLHEDRLLDRIMLFFGLKAGSVRS